ncbi:hypothetical protein [Bacteroidetes bacterium endosymbiont of Geopemphigus sp.]|uniref:hypothetical protein n=1 Tax=Bacteroidetes bacterium endosymbiont of Geopemphigus sp. TaxID=2047937 RepID=UPI000CD1D0C1|nr:hypothetical protein [Bacteroidetes bacterium endosymbiont of Geopemphigus sp.]
MIKHLISDSIFQELFIVFQTAGIQEILSKYHSLKKTEDFRFKKFFLREFTHNKPKGEFTCE